ncbi:transmembrane protein 71 isoform X3 [Ictalurus furcatus]|uniref:transmembrane protein 71 isoform X3 n=1 Tax=Ictalurus furcatus TaxID=66913 RepID=UPI00234FCD30|nr:transmembrane protein 71 isoform X3 [Ictalurus furcatus]
MDIFFRGTTTSSPIKNRNTQGRQPSYSFDPSFLSDTSYECFSTNPETGLVHVCRRSPRLLANGYYVLTEDSVVTNDQGNLTLTPTQTNISYKENLARIFRRRRKGRRSFATLLNDVSQSLLTGSIFGRDGTLSSTELSSCLDVSNSNEQDTSVYFTYGEGFVVENVFRLKCVYMCILDLCMSVADPTEMVPLKDKETLLPEVESLSEDCSTPVLPAQSLYCLIDVTPQSKCYCTPTNPPSGFYGLP